MNYAIGDTANLRPELRDKYIADQSIASLIPSGDRTGTTRRNFSGVKVGDLVSFYSMEDGRRVKILGTYRVTGFHKIDLSTKEAREEWNRVEGWSVEAARSFGSHVRDGATQMRFERADKALPAARKTSGTSAPTPSEKRVSVGVLAQILGEVAARFEHLPQILVREDINEALEENPKLPIARGDNVVGVTIGGKIILFRDRLANAAEAQRALFHELLHYGIRRFMSKEQYIRAMSDLYVQDAWIRNEADKWMKSGASDVTEAREFGGEDYVKARGVDEALARLAEINEGQFLKNHFLVRAVRAVARFIAGIAEMVGFEGLAASYRAVGNEEARALIREVFGKMKTNAAPATGFEGGAAFARRGTPLSPEALGTALDEEYGKTLMDGLRQNGAVKVHATVREAQAALELAAMPLFSGKKRVTLREELARWKEALKGFKKGGAEHVAKLAVPAVLRELGISESHLALTGYVLRGVGRKHPEITLDVLERLPEMLSRPLFVYPHRDVKAGRGAATGLTVITDTVDTKGQPVRVGVQFDEGRIATIFGVAEGWGEIADQAEAALREYPNAKVYAREGGVPGPKSGPIRFSWGALSDRTGGDVAAYSLYRTQQLFHGRKNLITWEDVVKANGIDEAVLYQAGWHASPHKFNEFSHDAIGSGEGQQTHGWGFYAVRGGGRERAEHVNDVYRRRLRKHDLKQAAIVVGGERHVFEVDLANISINSARAEEVVVKILVRESGNFEQAKGWLKEEVEYRDENPFKETFNPAETERYRQALKLMEENSDLTYEPPEGITEIVNIGKDTWTTSPTGGGLTELFYDSAKNPVGSAIRAVVLTRGDKAAAIELLKMDFDDLMERSGLTPDLLLERVRVYKEARALLQNNEVSYKVTGAYGQLFKLDLPEDGVLLDEQKKYEDQPEKVRASLDKLDKDFAGMTGKKIYAELTKSTGSPKKASLLLHKYGIEGIAYVGAQDGPAVVIFDPEQMKILEKYYQHNMAGAASANDPSKTPLSPEALGTALDEEYGKPLMDALRKNGAVKVHATAQEAQAALELAAMPLFSGKKRVTLREELARWKEALKGFKKNGAEHVAQLAVPAVLREMGVNVQSLNLSGRVVLYTAKKHPEITLDVLERLPEMLSRPLYVYPHRDVKAGRGAATNLNVITDTVDEAGNPVLVGLQIVDGRINTIFGVEAGWEGIRARAEAALQEYPNARVYARERGVPGPKSGPIRFSWGALSDRTGGDVATYGTYPHQSLFHGRKNLITWEDVVKANGVDEAVLYQAGYHASPHKFNEFSHDAIGSGEGYQTHGWGFYAVRGKDHKRADHVDAVYRRRLRKGDRKQAAIVVGGERHVFDVGWSTPIEGDTSEEIVVKTLFNVNGNFDLAKKRLRELVEYGEENPRSPDRGDGGKWFDDTFDPAETERYRQALKLLEENSDLTYEPPVRVSVSASVGEHTRFFPTEESGVADFSRWENTPVGFATRAVAMTRGDKAAALEQLKREIDWDRRLVEERAWMHGDPVDRGPFLERVRIYKEAKALLQNNEVSYKATGVSGQLFKLDLPEDGVLLDEQKKYEDQPEKVRASLDKLSRETTRYFKGMTGKKIYDSLVKSTGRPKKASLLLHKHGIQGIAYVGKHDGPSVVVFDPKQMKILEKYYQRNMAGAQGFFDGQTVHLIAENITRDEVRGLVGHEFWHKALKTMGFDLSVSRVEDIENPRLRTLMTRLQHLVKNPENAAWVKEAMAAVPEVDKAHPLRYLNEVAGYAVTQYENAQARAKMPKGILQFVKALFNALRDALVRRFPNLLSPTPARLAAIARGALMGSAQTGGLDEPLFARRLSWNDGERTFRTVGDFVVPELPEYEGNMTGDLARMPAVAGYPASPIRIEAGIASGEHRGFGMEHLADNARRDKGRAPRGETEALEENLVRDVVRTLHEVRQAYTDGTRGLVLYAPNLRKSVVMSRRNAHGGYWGIVTMMPEKNVLGTRGNRVDWDGRLTFPSPEGTATSATLVHDQTDSRTLPASQEFSARAPNNGGSGNLSSKIQGGKPLPGFHGRVESTQFDLNRTDTEQASSPAPSVTVKRRRSVEKPSLTDGPRTGERVRFASDEDVTKALEYLDSTLGDSVRVEVKKFLKAPEGGYAEGLWVKRARKNIIKLALNKDVVGAAYHESFHEFVDMLKEHGADNVTSLLERLGKNGIIKKRLEQLLEASPRKIEQLNNPEELTTYAYQFWRMGALKLGPDTTSFFKRVTTLFKRLTGLISKEMHDAQMAREVFERFSRGDFRDAKERKAMFEAVFQNSPEIEGINTQHLCQFNGKSHGVLHHTDLEKHMNNVVRPNEGVGVQKKCAVEHLNETPDLLDGLFAKKAKREIMLTAGEYIDTELEFGEDVVMFQYRVWVDGNHVAAVSSQVFGNVSMVI